MTMMREICSIAASAGRVVAVVVVAEPPPDVLLLTLDTAMPDALFENGPSPWPTKTLGDADAIELAPDPTATHLP